MKAISILFSFVLLTSCAQQASRNKTLSNLGEKGRVLASDDDRRVTMPESRCYWEGDYVKCRMYRREMWPPMKKLKSDCDGGEGIGCHYLEELELSGGGINRAIRDYRESCVDGRGNKQVCKALDDLMKKGLQGEKN